MVWGAYLLLIPLAVIIFSIGIAGFLNKLDINTYFLELTENQFDLEIEKRKQKKRNRILGIIFMTFSIVILLIPVIFQ